MRDLAIPAGMLVAPGAIGYAPELDQRLPHDPEGAKELLMEAGYPKGFSVTLDCPNNSNIINDEAICRAVAAQLVEVGIDVTANRFLSRSPGRRSTIARPTSGSTPGLRSTRSSSLSTNIERETARTRPAIPIRRSTS